MGDFWDPKSPDADLDYYLDFSPKLLEGEILQTVTWTDPEGVTTHDKAIVDTVKNGVVTKVSGSAKIWIGGGAVDKQYEFKCIAVTNQNRTFTVYPILKVKKEVYKG